MRGMVLSPQLLLLLVAWQPPFASDAAPVGIISATKTQNRVYGSQVSVSYFEPVNCTLDFSVNVSGMSASALTTSISAVVLNFVEVHTSRYTFQLVSSVAGNVSVHIEPGVVADVNGSSNTAATAAFSFLFYPFSPSVELQFEGQIGQATKNPANIMYLVFNSTTEYNGTGFFDESFISTVPALDLVLFTRVNAHTFRFGFTIPTNESAAASSTTCLDSNDTTNGSDYARYNCHRCLRPQSCQSRTTYPPAGVLNIEFPFTVHIAPVLGLGMSAQQLPFVYDTLWSDVELEAPIYANGPFYITITWAEAMHDLQAVQPVFSGLPVDQDLLHRNLTTLSPSSFKLLVAPARTGILTILINGSYLSKDIAGNANDFRRNPPSRTGAQRIVIFSAGPPIPGTLSFEYDRPRESYEVVESVTVPTSVAIPTSAPAQTGLEVPSLTVSWTGFTTAVRYDLWVSWGSNLTWPVVADLTSTSLELSDFRMLLGIEYTVHLRAWNVWGESTLVTKVILHPYMDVTADGSISILRLPDLLSHRQTPVAFHVLMPQGGFLSMNPTKVLRIRTTDTIAGDQDPCHANSPLMTCTFINFHLEVPGAQFIIFREPIRIQLTFGRSGWDDLYFRPQLRYWERTDLEWRSVAETCPQEQVYDRWNDNHRIYEISLCHLSQFAVFQYFSPPQPTQAPPPDPRPASFENSTVLLMFFGGMLALTCFCCSVYWACVQPSLANRRISYKELGIKPVNERMPSHAPAIKARQQQLYNKALEVHVPGMGRRGDQMQATNSTSDSMELKALTNPNPTSVLPTPTTGILPPLPPPPQPPPGRSVLGASSSQQRTMQPHVVPSDSVTLIPTSP